MRLGLAVVLIAALAAFTGAALTADAQGPAQPVTWEQVAPRMKEYTVIQYEAGAITASQRIGINNGIDEAVDAEQHGRPFPWP